MPFLTVPRLSVVLHIVKGESNEMIVTATEKQTIENAYFLLAFKHRVTNVTKAFILPDTSSYPNHHNIFTFTEGSDEDHTLATGQHDYTIYAQTSSSNVDPDEADEVLEVGIANVTGEVEVPAAFSNNQTFKQFEG